MAIVIFVENTSILSGFIASFHTHQNLTSAVAVQRAEIKFSTGGPLAKGVNEEQMSRSRKPMIGKRNCQV